MSLEIIHHVSHLRLRHYSLCMFYIFISGTSFLVCYRIRMINIAEVGYTVSVFFPFFPFFSYSTFSLLPLSSLSFSLCSFSSFNNTNHIARNELPMKTFSNTSLSSLTHRIKISQAHHLTLAKNQDRRSDKITECTNQTKGSSNTKSSFRQNWQREPGGISKG